MGWLRLKGMAPEVTAAYIAGAFSIIGILITTGVSCYSVRATGDQTKVDVKKTGAQVVSELRREVVGDRVPDDHIVKAPDGTVDDWLPIIVLDDLGVEEPQSEHDNAFLATRTTTQVVDATSWRITAEQKYRTSAAPDNPWRPLSARYILIPIKHPTTKAIR